MNAALYEPLIETAYRSMLAASTSEEVKACAVQMTALILARNDARTAAEIAQLERARGLV